MAGSQYGEVALYRKSKMDGQFYVEGVKNLMNNSEVVEIRIINQDNHISVLIERDDVVNYDEDGEYEMQVFSADSGFSNPPVFKF